jgi:Ni,Fe-hydrogenase I cytochrome b subunit
MVKNKFPGRIWILLLVLVIAAAIITGWYCYYSYQKNKVPEDATLVRKEAFFDEGEA